MSWSDNGLRALLAGLVIAGLSGCSDDAASEASREDASAGDSQAEDQVVTTPEAGTEEGGAEADAPVTDGPVTDAPQGCTPVAPEELASKQTITFRITNARQADVWVVTEGALCTPLGIERLTPSPEQIYLTGTSLPADHHCCTSSTGCDFNGRGPVKFGRLMPGESLDLQWDARRAVVDSCEFNCPGMNNLVSQLMAMQPVAAGSFKVSVGHADTLDITCTPPDAGDSEAICPVMMAMPSEQEPKCVAASYASAEFELQEGVDVTVPVTIQ